MKEMRYVPDMIEACCTDGFEVVFGYPLQRMKSINIRYFILGTRNDNALSANASQESTMPYFGL